MRFLLTISLACWLTAAQADSVRLLVQSSPLAGSQYYAVGAQWAALRVGDPLALIREPDNRHDRNAIRVEWRGHKLGYVPRAENRAVARERVLAQERELRERKATASRGRSLPVVTPSSYPSSPP